MARVHLQAFLCSHISHDDPKKPSKYGRASRRPQKKAVWFSSGTCVFDFQLALEAPVWSGKHARGMKALSLQLVDGDECPG